MEDNGGKYKVKVNISKKISSIWAIKSLDIKINVFSSSSDWNFFIFALDFTTDFSPLNLACLLNNG